MPQQTTTSSESKIRITAFFALVLIIAYLITGFVVFPLILLADFALRAFNQGAYSPLAFCLAITILHAALESLAGFCAGCYVYGFLKKF